MPYSLPPLGLGRIDLIDWLQAVADSVVLDVRGPAVHRSGNIVTLLTDPPLPRSFPGMIISAALVSGHTARWAYTMQMVYPLASTTGYEKHTGDEQFTVSNRQEYCHTVDPGSGSWIVWGVDKYGADYPAGFSQKPVGTGLATFITTVYTVTIPGGIRYEIDAMGSHDGTCT